ncbi:hypothetical protein [Peribacillus asahii]|uniref:hypothetical protein n=1 Tax=Peribacillus asahii TaxID=228899 RepID=UPI002079C1C4|nr:hypothetical protein [Peribacillus asahii]USK71340.1 hypothetical protein LIS76_06155 [Peribacillus asahii]
MLTGLYNRRYVLEQFLKLRTYVDHLKELIVKADSSMYEVKMNDKQMRAAKSEESIQY